MNQDLIVAKNIYKKYDHLQVLKGVNLSVKKGEIVALVGPSGAGKTTLLQILSTLDRPCFNKPADGNATTLTINEVDLLTLNDKQLSRFRNNNIGFIFQFHQLLPEFTALENVFIPALINKTSKIQAKKKAEELLGLLNLTNRRHHKPSQLSGGEQQRVAVARSLINNPDIIFADEPSGNLDSTNAKQLHKLFFDLREKFDQTFVIVTHNEDLANMADRKLVMRDGMI